MRARDDNPRRAARDVGGSNRRREDQIRELEQRRASQLPVESVAGVPVGANVQDTQGALDRLGPNAGSRAKQAFVFQS